MTSNLITKSIRLTEQENNALKIISQTEGVSEAAILKRFVSERMSEYRLVEAVTAYQRGEADLSAAASHAGISVYHMMSELERRDITPPAAAEKFMDGLKGLLETFGGSDALRQTLAEFEQNQ